MPRHVVPDHGVLQRPRLGLHFGAGLNADGLMVVLEGPQ